MKRFAPVAVVGFALGVVLVGGRADAAETVLFEQGAPGSYVSEPVPEGICSATVVIEGASGGSGFRDADPQAAGGSGASFSATIPVQPLQVFDVIVGGAGQDGTALGGGDGGFGGGGGGGAPGSTAGGDGGAGAGFGGTPEPFGGVGGDGAAPGGYGGGGSGVGGGGGGGAGSSFLATGDVAAQVADGGDGSVTISYDPDLDACPPEPPAPPPDVGPSGGPVSGRPGFTG